ncbi:17204_t:CDS:2, partial [Racocetra fulgida]
VAYKANYVAATTVAGSKPFSRDCKDNESTPPKMSQLGQFRRSKSSSILELFRDCKDNESTPPKMPELGQFRRAKSFSILELFKDCKDKENTPPKMPNTPPRTLKYSSPSHSPLSDQSESPLTSPLKRMAESPITHYFKRVDISKTVIKITVSATVGRRVSKSHVTPPTKSGINGYFHKMKGKHKKVSRYITEDKLRD